MESYLSGKGSLFYLSELVKFLFHIEVCMKAKDTVLQVFVPCIPVEKKQKLLFFFQQEASANTEIQVHFTRQTYMDHNACLGITTALWKADRAMDTAQLDCVDIMK